jgi:threonine dehydrogenase-like Zn-dependent dehydrogenase
VIKKMKALMWNAPEQMDLIEIDRPNISADEVLIKVHTAGICGSDLEGYLGHNSLRKPPLLMGHEFAGEIEAVGTGVTNARVGQRVVINPLLSCGACPRCVRGRTNLCDNRKIVGIHRPGGYAEYAAVPAKNVHLIDERLSYATAALTEPLACSLRAVRRAMADLPFANTAVIGAGAIGLLSAFVARILGASKVIVLDINPNRLKTLGRFPFDGVIDSSDSDAMTRIRRITGGEGVDVVIDAAGFQPTRSLAASLVNSGGVIMNIGLGIDDTVLPVNHFIRSEIEVKGSFCYTEQDFTDALKLLADGKVSEAGWTEIRPLSAGGPSFSELVSGKSGFGKILLQP